MAWTTGWPRKYARLSARPPRTWWAGRTGGSRAEWSMARHQLPWSGPPLGPSLPDSTFVGAAIQLSAHPNLISGSQPQCPDTARLTGTRTRHTYPPGHEGSSQENLTSCLQAQTRSGRWPGSQPEPFPLRQEAPAREQLLSFSASSRPPPGHLPHSPTSQTSGFAATQSAPTPAQNRLASVCRLWSGRAPGTRGDRRARVLAFRLAYTSASPARGAQAAPPFHG